MIEETVKIHDRFQIEIKLNYSVKQEQKSTDYTIDSYLFIPNSLDINKESYQKEQFYQDLQAYIRFKTPTVPLVQFLNESGPAITLETECKQFAATPSEATHTIFEQQIKLFCNTFRSTLRDHIDFIKDQSKEDIKLLTTQFLDHTKQIITFYRKLRPIIMAPTIPKDAFTKYLLGDEFISLVLEQFGYRLFHLLKKINQRIYEQFEQKILQLIYQEVTYRSEHNYPSIPDKTGDNELLLYRKSILKKYINSILYLNTRTREEGELRYQIIYGIAAGMAMIFATGTAFLAQHYYGNFTFPLFAALVVSYIFKDRIKEITRNHFKRRIDKNIFDHKTTIYTDHKKKIGRSRELFRFLKPQHLDSELLQVRDRKGIVRLGEHFIGEQTFLYRKNIKITTKQFQKFYATLSVTGLTDIIRLNLYQFIKKMDNPRKKIEVTNGITSEIIRGDRVYHLNLILRYQQEDQITFSQFRIILNRKGIKRIEQAL